MTRIQKETLRMGILTIPVYLISFFAMLYFTNELQFYLDSFCEMGIEELLHWDILALETLIVSGLTIPWILSGLYYIETTRMQ
jgi:hypothetical protein